MGVKFAREYKDIIDDLTAAIYQVGHFYESLGMEGADWDELDKEEQAECVRTLADDVFYGLGGTSSMPVGHGVVRYDQQKHVITVDDGDKRISIVYLV